MAKRYPSGFVPIPFKSAGKVLFPISLLMIIVGGLDYFMDWAVIPTAVLFVGLGLSVVSLYLIFVVPEEEGINIPHLLFSSALSLMPLSASGEIIALSLVPVTKPIRYPICSLVKLGSTFCLTLDIAVTCTCFRFPLCW